MNKKIAFLTTIFPMKKEYLIDFFNSLQNQTINKFDIIVVNDGYNDFDKIKMHYGNNLNIIELKYSNSIAKNREYGINYCIENNYDILIFGDSDDYFDENRVEKSIELLKTNDIVVNDLSLFNENAIYEKKYISNRIENNSIINIEFIRDKNIFGLSNTAILLKNLDKISLYDDLIAVDWYIFTLLLLGSKKSNFY
ncbi:MAG: glycosyltransferase [Sulfurimonas sp.]|nr:glycosyltransferase [Sulfurimonas sp.]